MTEKARALALIGHEKYGLRLDSVPDIRRRIRLFLDTGLAAEIGPGRYRATPLGLRFAESLPLQEPEQREADGQTEVDPGPAQALIERLREAARAAKTSEHFEQVTAEAFRYLGFEAEWLGQAGETDVLITATIGPQDTLRAIVDTKASSNGVVEERRLQFETLNEHKEKHNARYTVVVGESFERRLPNWAKHNNVTLLTVDRLAEVIQHQDRFPLSPAELLPLLHSDEEGSLEGSWVSRGRERDLMTSILAQLAREARAKDPITKGTLTVDILYRLLRDQLDPPPDITEIENVLMFLSSPLMGCVTQREKHFGLAMSPAVIAKRLEMLATAASDASVTPVNSST
jgi:hypothetical protein